MPRRTNEPSAGDVGDTAATVDAVLARESAPRGVRPVAALNPEAGEHAVTTDPRELRAALRAGELTRQRFGYYEQRYGERGLRFTRSDSAWIVTLADEPHGVAERQLAWLGRVLASRGMPRWLLEVHLETLYAELVTEVPERTGAYDVLLEVAATFRGERFSTLEEASSTELAQAFDARVGPALVARLPEAGALLVAAVADELAGLTRAVASLMEWLADPEGFPDAWVSAATWTVTAARERADRTAPVP